MRTAYRKVLRDLWGNKGRTTLVVLSIAVGVMAVGMILSSNSLMERQITVAQKASQPSNVRMFLQGLIDDDTVHSIARIPEVEAAQGRAEGGIRWKPMRDAEWQDARVIAIDDYGAQLFDLLELRSGVWPSSQSVAVEWNHVIPFGVPELGSEIYFEVNERARPLIVGGTLRDPGEAAPPFATEPVFYVTRDVMERLTGVRDFDQLRFSILEYSEEQAERVADIVEDKLERQGVGVGFTWVQDPERHWAQETADGIGLILTVMAVASLFLSAILVINTINAVIAQQIPQIGILKTVGGVSRQISQLYLAGVVIYSLLSLALAVPLGALAGGMLARSMLGILNVPSAAPFQLVSSTLGIQLGAGLLVPLAAAIWPVLRGVAISVREALSRYGLGSGRYGTGGIDRILGRVRGLPRTATLALRNTFRRMGRVVLTQAVLVTAGAIFMMVVSTHFSFTEAVADIWRGLGSDAFVVFNGSQRIDEIVPLIEARSNVDRVEMWVRHNANARVPGETGPGGDFQVALQGIPRDSEMYTPKLTAGRGLDPADGHALLLNQKLAGDMGLTLGDPIEIDLGEDGSSTWTIVGLIFDLINDQTTAYVHIDTLNRELHQVGRASVARIRAIDDSREAQTALSQDLRDAFDRLGIDVASARTATESQEEAEAQFSILTTILMTMAVLMAVVGSIGLSGTLSINVIERRREIGVMRAVGASSMDVALIFMGEGLLLGLSSWALAVPLSMLAGRPFVEALGPVIEFPAQYQLAVSGLWIWLIIVVVLSLVASWLPARRATQISVNESLAYA